MGAWTGRDELAMRSEGKAGGAQNLLEHHGQKPPLAAM